MRNLLVLATLSSFMISCASIKSMFGSSEAPAAQEQPKPTDPLDISDADSAERVAPAPSADGQPATQATANDGAELSNHADPAVAEAASDLAAQTQSPANNISGENQNLPPKVINEEMRQSYGVVEAPQIYNTNSYSDAPPKKGKKAAVEKKSAKGKKEVAKKPKVDCKKVAKAGKKAKKTDVAYCKAEKKALAAAKKPKVDCKKVAKAGTKAKKADVAFCKAEKKKKAAKSRVASKY